MSILSIRLNDGVQSDSFDSEDDDVLQLLRCGSTALQDMMREHGGTPPASPSLPVITPKTTEVEDAQIKVDSPIVATSADLERLFGPLTEIRRMSTIGPVDA